MSPAEYEEESASSASEPGKLTLGSCEMLSVDKQLFFIHKLKLKITNAHVKPLFVVITSSCLLATSIFVAFIATQVSRALVM